MKVFRWCSFLSLTVASLLIAAPIQASDDWWFDVEVIVFERKLDLTQLDEQFELTDNLAPPLVEADVIGDAILPNISWLKQGLPTCDEAPQPVWPAGFAPLVAATSSAKHDEDATVSLGERTTNSTRVAKTTNAGQHITQEHLTSAPTHTTLSAPTDPDVANSELAALVETSEVTVPQVRACEDTQPWLAYRNGEWHTYQPDNRLPAPSSLPITPEGFDWPNASHAHLLPASAQQLTSLSRQIRQSRDLTRLLHITWRQPVKFGKDNAFNVRLFAGENYADRFSLSGKSLSSPTVSDKLSPVNEATNLAVTPISDFFDTLEQKLSAPTPIDFAHFNDQATLLTGANDEAEEAGPITPIWQLDGSLKVFLKYINRVPYLHIDSQLFYRQPIPLLALTANENRVDIAEFTDNSNTTKQPDYRLVAVPFSEQRRVISKQLHYFDHPLFGMVVEIRRYNRPSSPSQ